MATDNAGVNANLSGWSRRSPLSSREAAIAGLDSLWVTKLRSTVPRELGRAVDRIELLRCNTLQDLLQAIERAPEADMEGLDGGFGEEAGLERCSEDEGHDPDARRR